MRLAPWLALLEPAGSLVPTVTGALPHEGWRLFELHSQGLTEVAERLSQAFTGVVQVATVECQDARQECLALEVLAESHGYSFVLCAPGPDLVPPRVQSLELAPEVRAVFVGLGDCTRRYTQGIAEASQIAAWVAGEAGIAPTQPELLSDSVKPKSVRNEAIGGAWQDAGVTPSARGYDGLAAYFSLLHQRYDVGLHHVAIAATVFLTKHFPAGNEQLAQLAVGLEAGPQDAAVFRTSLGTLTAGLGMDPSKPRYETCPDESCAVWTLLHVTLAAVSAKGADEQAALGLSLIEETVAFVRALVENFLPCRSCKQRFLQEFDSCMHKRCDMGSDHSKLSLWLWRVHNAVSLQVAAQLSVPLDRRWPQPEDCQLCWRPEATHCSVSETSCVQELAARDVDSSFNLEQVYWHLIGTYLTGQLLSGAPGESPDEPVSSSLAQHARGLHTFASAFGRWVFVLALSACGIVGMYSQRQQLRRYCLFDLRAKMGSRDERWDTEQQSLAQAAEESQLHPVVNPNENTEYYDLDAAE